jgi:hypothetical protein
MARYTETIVAAARHRYENTNQPLRSIAAELLIGERNLQRMVTKYGWAKRIERVQGLPVAMQSLEEANALGAQSAHSRDSGNPVSAAGAPEELGPRLRGDERTEMTSVLSDCVQTPTPILPLAGGGNLSAIDRIEQLVLKEIEAEEAERAELGGKQRAATASERCARTLATLTQALQALQRLRAGTLPDHESLHDDDMPRDIDEFRRDLARRIDAFVASRTDAADADGDSRAAPVDEVR